MFARFLSLCLVLVAAAACGDDVTTPEVATPLTPRPRVTATSTADPAGPTASPTVPVTATGTGTETDTATPEPTQMPVPEPSCEQGREEREAHYAEAATEIEAAMEGYDGTWGLAVIDLDCETAISVHADYVQYTASAGKIIPVIAALRKVQQGDLDFELIEPHLDEVLHHSLDSSADFINDQVTVDEVQSVLAKADVSGLTRYEGSWRYTFMPAMDLARVWESLLRGKQLNKRWTEYLLDLASEVELPPEYATFPDPDDLGRDGYQMGQKAGYYVVDGVPYYLLGAGYLRPVDGSSLGFAMVFEMKTMNPELFDPQRRSVFPIILEYILDS